MPDETREIPAGEWISFLDDFTREHRGFPVRIEVRSPEGRTQVEARDVPLQGISADDRGSERDINIIVGNEQNPGLTHIIPGAIRLRVARGMESGSPALLVEAADGSRTTVTVREAVQTA